jgi:hypothetical protein
MHCDSYKESDHIVDEQWIVLTQKLRGFQTAVKILGHDTVKSGRWVPTLQTFCNPEEGRKGNLHCYLCPLYIHV